MVRPVKEDEMIKMCGTIAVRSPDGSLNAMFEDILSAAWYGIRKGYRVNELIAWNYLSQIRPVARVAIIGPDGQEYDATIRHITGEGWRLDHMSKWRKQESTTSKSATAMT